MKEIYQRLISKTPLFFKRLQVGCLAIGSAGGLILATPLHYPAHLTELAPHFMTIGVVGFIISQLTKE